MEDAKINVFLVDDEPLILQWLIQNTQWDYYSCSVAGYSTLAEEALQFLSKNHVDLLITDVTMPDMDGLSLIRQAKQLQSNLRVIVISAHSNFEFIKQALLLGVENYLLKPIDPKELHNTLQMLTEKICETPESASRPEPFVFRNNLLQQWARNEFFEFNFIEHAEMAHLNLCCASYTVTAIRLGFLEQERLCHLFELCNQFYPQWNGYFFIDRSSDFIGILPDFQKQQRPVLKSLYEELAGQTDKNVFMTIGPSVNSYCKLHISYQVAASYLSASMFLTPTVWECEDFPYAQYESPVKDREARKLEKLILENGIGPAIANADTLLKQNLEFPLRSRAVALAIYILKMIRQPYSFSEEQCTEIQHFRLFSSENDIANWIHHLIRLVARINNELNGQLHPYVSKAMAYLQSYYEDPELSLQSVAEGLNVNTAYLGQLFRTQTGKYFNDYLSDVRMETSCSLLIETSLRIRDIAQKVGIPNQSYYNRIFKKKYVLTPVEYRQRYTEIKNVESFGDRRTGF